MGRDHWALLFGLCLRFSNEHARNEHECSAKSHLQSCGERWRIHVPVPHEDLEGIVEVEGRAIQTNARAVGSRLKTPAYT